MNGIPEGQIYELSKSPKIRVSRFFEDALVEFGESRANLKDLVADKQYSELVVLFSYFMVENDVVAENEKDFVVETKLPPLSPKTSYPSPMDELEAERKRLITIIQQSKWQRRH
jgi:hypothetical protein